MKRRFVCLLLLLLFALNCFAVVNIERFEVLNTASGLSQNSVESIFCDHRGYLWFGTMNGLNCYDGYHFKVYKSEYGNPYSLGNCRIVKIWEDANGFIWLKSHDGHQHYLDRHTDRFYSFPSTLNVKNKSNYLISFYQQLGNQVCLGTNSNGLYYLYDVPDSVYRIQHLTRKNYSQLPSDTILCMLADSQRNLWAGTPHGIVRFQANQKKDHLSLLSVFLKNERITAIEESHGIIYVGSASGKVWCLETKEGPIRLSPVLSKQTNGIIRFLKYSENGMLWIGTENAGLSVYNLQTKQIKRFFKGQAVRDLYQDKCGDFWVGTSDFGITRIRRDLNDSKFFELVPSALHSLIDKQRQFLFEDRDSNLWVATHGGGIGVFDKSSQSFQFFRNDPHNPNSLSSNIAYCVTQDHEGIIWVGTGQFNGGANKVVFADPRFRQLRPVNEISTLSDNVIRSLMQDDQNRLWVASKAGHLYVYDDQMNQLDDLSTIVLKNKKSVRFNVYTMLEDRRGYLWLGSKGGGIARSCESINKINNLRGMTFQLFVHQVDDSLSLADNNVYSLVEDKEGCIWVGTYGSGVCRIKDPVASRLRFQNFDKANSGLSSDEVRYLFCDSKQRIWAATTFGLNLWQPNQKWFRNFFYQADDSLSLSYNDVIYLNEDNHGEIWLATFGGGVDQVKEDDHGKFVFRHLGEKQGLVNDAVVGLLTDETGNLWFATENGVSLYDADSKSFQNFDSHSGLLCSNFSEGTCIRLNDGRLAFGSLNGVLLISNKKLVRSNFVPPVVFTRFSVFNQNLPDFGSQSFANSKSTDPLTVTLAHDQSSFSVGYAALSFFDPQKTMYSYKLDGFDSKWYQVNDERKASYTNVPSGTYLFEVKAKNLERGWTSSPAVIKVVILPPWWQKWWAWGSYVVLLFLMFFMIRRLFFKMEHLRTELKVEHRINEMKFQFFTNVSHEIRTPLTLILGPVDDLLHLADLSEEVRHQLAVINRNGRRMLYLVNELLDFRKLQNKKMKLDLHTVDLSELIKNTYSHFESLAEQKNVDFSYSLTEQPLAVTVDPEKIDSVIFNLLSNAFKFTEGGKSVQIRIEQSNTDDVFIKVIDSGKGIEKEKLPYVFDRYFSFTEKNKSEGNSGIGLAYAYEIMKLHGGDLKVESVSGEGSTFIAVIPAKAVETKIKAETIPATTYSKKDLFPDKPTLNPESDECTSSENPLVLVVEDYQEIRDYIGLILGNQFRLIYASNGKEGLECLDHSQPDLIVTDLMMPEMDGLEMTRQIKSSFAYSHIPVVMLTARSSVDDQIQGIDCGAEAYVVKPFNARYLRAVIQNLLQQRKNVVSYLGNEKIPNSHIQVTGKDELFLRQLVDLIEKKCQLSDFSVEQLVRECALGRTVFYNKVKSLTGMTPVEFVRNVKLQLAAKFLTEGGCSVAEAAYQSGFSDLKYFSRKFKERYQVPPSKYRSKGRTSESS